MAAQRKQYFLSPNFDYPPDGPIQLGRIFTSPKKLSEAINPLPEHIIPIPPGQKFETSKKNFKTTVSHPNSGFKIGLFAGFLQQFLPASADINLEVNRARESILSADELKTTFFEPSDDYVSQALNVPAVFEKLGDPSYFTRLFMVTGVKTISGGSKASGTITSNISGELKAQADLTALGAPGVSPGFTVGGGAGPTETMQWEVSDSPYVFAYRLREIQYRHGKWASKPYDNGALYGLKEAQKEGQTLEESRQPHEERRIILVNMVADDDLGLDDLQPVEKEGLVAGLAADDDDGFECTFVSILGESR